MTIRKHLKYISGFIIIFMAVIFLSLYGCSENIEWLTDDFAFYDNNNIQVAVCDVDWEYVIDLPEDEDVRTFRGVRIGDDAVTALEKYLVEGYAIFIDYDEANTDGNVPETFGYETDSDLKEIVENAEHTLIFYLFFDETDEKYSLISNEKILSAVEDDNLSELYTYVIVIYVNNEAVSGVKILKSY